MVASFGLAALGLAAATAWRLSARERAAKERHPPRGEFVSVAGTRVHVQVQGSGPDLVLIHGANGNLGDFATGLAPRLADRFRVILIDRPGLGHSDPLPGGVITVDAQARHLRTALESLGITRPIVLGQSYGGAVALAWALQAPPAALVLVSAVSMPWPGALDPWYRVTSHPFGRHTLVPLASAFVPDAYFRRSLDRVFAPQAPPPDYAEQIGIDLTLRHGSLRTTVDQINNLRPEIVRMSARYPALDIPIELVHGDADTIVPLQIHAEPAARLLPGARLTVLPGAGHMPHHSHPDQVIAGIDRAAERAGLRAGGQSPYWQP